MLFREGILEFIKNGKNSITPIQRYCFLFEDLFLISEEKKRKNKESQVN